jgi:hypothetical protein
MNKPNPARSLCLVSDGSTLLNKQPYDTRFIERELLNLFNAVCSDLVMSYHRSQTALRKAADVVTRASPLLCERSVRSANGAQLQEQWQCVRCARTPKEGVRAHALHCSRATLAATACSFTNKKENV